MEADFARHGIDLRDAWRPRGGAAGLSPRRLWLLITSLPMPLTADALKKARKADLVQRLRAQQTRTRREG